MANENNEIDGLESLIGDPKIRRIIATAILYTAKAAKFGGRAALVKLLGSFSAYEPYLLKTYERVSNIKTFADPMKPVSLLDHFVETKLIHSKNKIVNQDDIRESIIKNEKIILSALAGFGKSVLMRFLALSFYENPTGKIPIFIELRDLNRIKNPNLISYIHSTYKQNSNLNKDVFVEGLKKGVFVLFFDGFDEINFEHRSSIQEQILDLCDSYPEISILVSSRPDMKFDSWSKFSTYHIQPMDLKQVTELINKIEYNDVLKKKFLEKLRNNLFHQHQSFMSTPLLATLMMLTYEKNANIPDRMHLFYLRAFETLFDKHDTYKEQYERKRKTELRIDEFSKLFSVFCFNTYISEEFEFSKISIIEYLGDAISYCGLYIDVEDVLFDLTESVCLIQLEGLFYSFVHRSFQEYFTAVFLSQCPDDFRNDFLNEFNLRPWDTVLPMLFDMSQDRLEVGWVLPTIASFMDEVNSSKVGISRYVFFCMWKSAEFAVHKNKVLTFTRLHQGKYRHMFAVLRAFYPTKFARIDQLRVADIDELGEQLSVAMGYTYAIFSSDQRDVETSRSKIFDFGAVKNFPIKNKMVKYAALDYKSVVAIKESVGDHKVVQQRFLMKVKQKRGGGFL
jgi:hypothetical protein